MILSHQEDFWPDFSKYIWNDAKLSSYTYTMYYVQLLSLLTKCAIYFVNKFYQ